MDCQNPEAEDITESPISTIFYKFEGMPLKLA